MTRGVPSRLPVAVQHPAQQRFAHVLRACTVLGLALLALGFGAYVSGLAPSHVDVQRLPALWGLPLKRFVEVSGTPTGWGWIAALPAGDALALAGIAVLALGSLVALLGVLPIYARRGDRAYVLIAAAEVLVLALAAWGFGA